MKFGEKFTEYLHGEGERFRNKYSHVEYKRLKKVLKRCRLRDVHGDAQLQTEETLYSWPEKENVICGQAAKRVSKPCDFPNATCPSRTCSVCDKIFFYELTNEISAIVGCFSSRARRLLHLHLASGFQRYLWRIKHRFADDHQAMIQEGRNLVSYVAMNAIAVRKILKKYDKVHRSVNGRDFKIKLQAKHIELLKSPWLIELGAFQINTRDSGHGYIGEIFPECSCDFSGTDPVITCTLPDSVKLEFSLTCPICLDTVFDPVALGCGHIFCNSCACSGASVPTIEGVKAANRRAKCPICRQMGVYTDAVHLTELGLLVKRRCREYWKERLLTERAQRVKQAKEHWDLQSRFILGF
uniref:RING-type E3 ubiquitin transferase n=1 Tax=Araucaria cunninghamii TaxID=56994 RepID=A0A0D6R0C5_ARACU